MKLSMEDHLVNAFKSIEGIFDIYRQSKDTVDFRNVLKRQTGTPNLKTSHCRLQFEEAWLKL